jgi:hypothetical protein
VAVRGRNVKNGDSMGEWLFHGRGTHRRNGYLPGNTRSLTTNPLEEWDSTGNHRLMDADSEQQDQHVRKFLQTVTIPRSETSNASYRKSNLFKKI